MDISELKKVSNFIIADIEQFKKVVIEAIESECHINLRKYGHWLYEGYEDFLDKNRQYCAEIIIINECCNKSTEAFRVKNENISSITIYHIFYTDIVGGGFVIDNIPLYHDAINSLGIFFK